MVMTSHASRATSTVATTIATMDAGRDRRMRGSSTISATTRATIARDSPADDQSAVCRAVRATSAVFSPSGLGMSSARGTCCRKMSVAMPMVKPSTTGQGMKSTMRPRPNSPMATTIPPAMIATGITAAAP